jgi:hypothetical protein
MRTHILRFIFAVVLFGIAVSSHAGQDTVRDWTIKTPIGHFGYAEINWSNVYSPRPRVDFRYIYLGPVGRVELRDVALISLIFGRRAALWFAS